MRPIAGLKVEFTKTQFIEVLKGSSSAIKNKVNRQKLIPITGILKN